MMDEDNYRNNGRAGDDPQAAFEQLRGEVALVRLAVEGLARARESIEIPDYQPTLANTEKILLALTHRVEVIAKSPAMKLTPATMGERVNTSVTRDRKSTRLYSSHLCASLMPLFACKKKNNPTSNN